MATKTLEELLAQAEAELPAEYQLQIHVEEGYASVAILGDGFTQTFERYDTFTEKVAAALEWAREDAKKSDD